MPAAIPVPLRGGGPDLASYTVTMKITVLADVEREGADCDVVVGQVQKALAKSGHRASVLPVHGDLGKMVASPLIKCFSERLDDNRVRRRCRRDPFCRGAPEPPTAVRGIAQLKGHWPR